MFQGNFDRLESFSFGIKCGKSNSENRREVNRKTPNSLDNWNGYSEFLAFLMLKNFLSNIYSFEQIVY